MHTHNLPSDWFSIEPTMPIDGRRTYLIGYSVEPHQPCNE